MAIFRAKIRKEGMMYYDSQCVCYRCLMSRCGWWLVIFLFTGSVIMLGTLWCWMLYGWPQREICHVLDLTPIRNVSDHFLSIAMDTGLLRDGRIPRDLRSPKLRNMAALLAPGYLRVGGTAADCLVFEESPELQAPGNHSYLLLDGGECSYEGFYCKERPSQFSMTGRDWEEINEFASNTSLDLVFDLNVLLRDGHRWNSTNAAQLLHFSKKRGYSVVWQLGNEPNSFGHVFQMPLSGYQLGEDFVVLRSLLEAYGGGMLVGPDVTRPKDPSEESVHYLRDFLSSIDAQTLDAVTWHQYYLNGRTAQEADFLNPAKLDVLVAQIGLIDRTVREHLEEELPLWLSETSSAYGGGAPGLSDRFLAGFSWLDKLGVSARTGIDIVVRQSLLGGHYALLDNDTFQPRPDWWLSLLFKTLVGRTVFMDRSFEHAGRQVRLYYHCSSDRSRNSVGPGLTVYGMNLKSTPVDVQLPDIPAFKKPSAFVSAYILTGEGGLTSKTVLLNGKRLELNPDGSVPPFVPVHFKLSEPLAFPPTSMGFWVLQGIDLPVCR